MGGALTAPQKEAPIKYRGVDKKDVHQTLCESVGKCVLVTTKDDADRTLVVFGHLTGVSDTKKLKLEFSDGARYFFVIRGHRQVQRDASAPAKISVSREPRVTRVETGDAALLRGGDSLRMFGRFRIGQRRNRREPETKTLTGASCAS